MGTRLLVRSRVNKVLKSLARELLDDNNSDENRLKCARLLESHVSTVHYAFPTHACVAALALDASDWALLFRRCSTRSAISPEMRRTC
jgi:hypothetical protein